MPEAKTLPIIRSLHRAISITSLQTDQLLVRYWSGTYLQSFNKRKFVASAAEVQTAL